MSVQQKRPSKKEKKAVAFRTRKGKGRSRGEEAPDVPIIDVSRDEEDGHSQPIHQTEKTGGEKPVNKKRKRLDVEEDDEDANPVPMEEPPKQKKQKREIKMADAGEQTNLETKLQKHNSSKYILFVGKNDSRAE
jgi:hypothetical protein